MSIFKNWKTEICTIPNFLSLFRLALIPVYVEIYLNAKLDADYALSAGILAVSCLTDLVDGKIARRFNMVSTIGKILDPLADKITQFTLIVCLAIRHAVLWWLIGLFVVKESFQFIVGAIHLRMGKILPGALLAGKICTTVLFISLVLMVLLPHLPESVITVLAGIDAVFMTFSLVSYVRAYFGSAPVVTDLHPKGEA